MTCITETLRILTSRVNKASGTNKIVLERKLEDLVSAIQNGNNIERNCADWIKSEVRSNLQLT
jgi:hypothetical protein